MEYFYKTRNPRTRIKKKCSGNFCLTGDEYKYMFKNNYLIVWENTACRQKWDTNFLKPIQKQSWRLTHECDQICESDFLGVLASLSKFSSESCLLPSHDDSNYHSSLQV